MNHKRVAVLIPAYNEAVVIGDALEKLGEHSADCDVYVVDDASTDETAQIAQEYCDNVLVLLANLGKARALTHAIQWWKLSMRYEFILPLDADTTLEKDFFTEMLQMFEDDENNRLVAIAGRVTSNHTNWLTGYRAWEYELAHTIHKSAQAIIGTILVCPGCSTLYRSSLLQKVAFLPDTLAEDMDLTFTIHRQKMGAIGYCDKARVITQDPRYIRDFVSQIRRWYKGFWQCVLKHTIPWGGQPLDAEVVVLSLEGLFNSLFILMYILLLPWLLRWQPSIALVPIMIDLSLFMLPSLLLTRYRWNYRRLFIFLPHMYLMRVIGSIVFLFSFFEVVIRPNLVMSWFSPRRYRVMR